MGIFYCCVKVCSNNSMLTNISLFRIPNDQERCLIWTSNCRRTDLTHLPPKQLHDNYRVCSIHFEEQMFSGLLKNRLKKDATPTIFNWNIKLEQSTPCLIISMNEPYMQLEKPESTVNSSMSPTPCILEECEGITIEPSSDFSSVQTQTPTYMSSHIPHVKELKSQLTNLKRKLLREESKSKKLKMDRNDRKEHFSETLTNNINANLDIKQEHPKAYRAETISDLKLIDKQSENVEQHSTVTIAKPIAKRAGRSQSVSESGNTSNTKFNTSINSSHAKSKPIDIEVKNSTNDGACSYKNNTPNRREKNKGKWGKGWKDEECFGSPLDHKISKDFDFEKNLALFNKQALWEELNAQKPDVVKQADKKVTKYRHDENVIATIPTSYRQITVPKQDFCEYVTDDGLIIPSISHTLRKKLWETADRVGLTWERRIELIGRAATEISIQLLGGGHRLNPHNTHQWPTVVFLCGPHKQGAAGINAARQLASHGIKTIVFIISMDAPIIKKELSLYMLTKNRVLNNVADLPNIGDLIIAALCEETDSPKDYPLLADWINKNKAPVLAIDPPTGGIPGITPKFSLLPVLPLPHSSDNGKLYLCNLGFPVDVFNEVGIKYKSPFGPKFVIPLHPKDD